MPVLSLAETSTTLPRIYAWFSAMIQEDRALMQALMAHGMLIDSLHPLRDTTALLEAAKLGRVEMVEWLIDQGADADMLSGLPLASPLHCALRRRHWQVAATLISYMEDVSKPDGLRRNALHLLSMEPLPQAEASKSLTVARAVIRHGCPLNAPDQEGITALHHCAINDGLELAELLLANGAKVDSTVAETGVTPLVIAALEKNNAMCELLLRFGADPYHKTRDGARAASIYPPLLRIVMRAKVG